MNRFFLLALVAACGRDSLPDRSQPDAASPDTFVRLRIVNENGPLEGQVVWALDDASNRVGEGLTDASGRARVRTSVAGPLWLVANDGHGQGVVVRVTVQPVGTTEAGERPMAPLAEQPAMTWLRNVDFEERVTQFDGWRPVGYRSTRLFDQGRIALVSQLKNVPGLHNPGRLVRVEVATGLTRVLVERELPNFGYGGLNEAVVTFMADDTTALWVDGWQEGNTRHLTLSVYDVVNDRVILEQPMEEPRAGGIFVVDAERRGDEVFIVQTRASVIESVRLSLSDGTLTTLATDVTFSDQANYSYPTFRVHRSDTRVVLEWNDSHPGVIAFDRATYQIVGRASGYFRYAVGPGTCVIGNTEEAVTELDFETHASRLLVPGSVYFKGQFDPLGTYVGLAYSVERSTLFVGRCGQGLIASVAVDRAQMHALLLLGGPTKARLGNVEYDWSSGFLEASAAQTALLVPVYDEHWYDGSVLPGVSFVDRFNLTFFESPTRTWIRRQRSEVQHTGSHTWWYWLTDPSTEQPQLFRLVVAPEKAR